MSFDFLFPFASLYSHTSFEYFSRRFSLNVFFFSSFFLNIFTVHFSFSVFYRSHSVVDGEEFRFVLILFSFTFFSALTDTITWLDGVDIINVRFEPKCFFGRSPVRAINSVDDET